MSEYGFGLGFGLGWKEGGRGEVSGVGGRGKGSE